MKTNAIISALCVVGILSALCSNGEEKQSVIETRARPEVTPLPVQKVVYWSDIPGMKWNWTTQVTNKPSIPTVGTLNTTATSAQSTSASESLSGNITLHKIAKTGAYGDLSGTPTIPTVGTLNTTLTTSQATSANESFSGTINLHKVSKTGKLEDLSGASLTIGNVDTKYVKIKQTGEIQVFDDFGDSVVYTLNLPDKNGHLAVLSDIPSTNGLASKSWVNSHKWDWTEVTNKPSIPAAQVNADWNASSGVAQILNKPTLATVATSGSYNDLSNKPTIPEKTVWYGTSSDSVAVTTRSVTTTTGDFRLENGSRIYVYFERAFQGYSLTLNVDNTGAKSVSHVRNDSLPQYYFVNGQVVEFIYDETSQRYVVVDGAVATTTYYGRTVLENSTNSTSNAKAATPNSVRQVALAIGAERTARLNAGYATQSWVNNHKWDWVTQVTNSPFVFHTTGFPYVEVPFGFAATDSGQGYAVPSSASFAGAKVHGIESLGAGDGIITNCYGGIGLGMAFNVTNDVAFVWSGRNFNAAKYGSHGMSTFNVDPHDGPAGFWIGETNLATYLANAGSGEHTHSNLVNGTTQVIANQNGTASIVAPIEWAFVTQLTASQKQSLAQYMQSQYSFNGDWTVTIDNHNASWWESEFASGTHSGIDYEDYMDVKIGNVTAAMGIMDWDNKICICAGGDANILNVLVPSYEPQVSPIAQFIGGIKTIATVDQLPTIPANVSAFNNDAGYVKTNAVGSLVLGPPSANQASRAYTIVAGTGGANNESDNSIIIGPGSHIYQNSDYSGIFGPGGSIKAGSSYSFVFGASTVEAGCPNSFVIGSSATSTNASSFLWTADSTGNKTLPAAKITHGDGTFNINTLDGVAGVYIGDTNLQQIIRMEARAMIAEALADVNTNIQTAEDARAALTNLITILKSGAPSNRERLLEVEQSLNELVGHH